MLAINVLNLFCLYFFSMFLLKKNNIANVENRNEEGLIPKPELDKLFKYFASIISKTRETSSKQSKKVILYSLL
jgi:predicted AlkP superfamily phosphohydrolase/phosphomutase